MQRTGVALAYASCSDCCQKNEFALWSKRSLADKHYIYVWADGNQRRGKLHRFGLVHHRQDQIEVMLVDLWSDVAVEMLFGRSASTVPSAVFKCI